MWFLLSIGTMLFWSGSDLFSKIGCQDGEDRYAYLKMVMAVGTVMGIHALWQIFTGKAVFSMDVALRYAPVSALYILSMAIGYLGLRYIELSISSPICNSSGALTALLSFFVFGLPDNFSLWSGLAIALTCAGVVALGIAEVLEDENARELRQELSGRTYAKRAIAFLIPVIYCLIDAVATLYDSVLLETLDENSANVAYELTFFLCGILCAVYVLGIKKQKLTLRQELPKYGGACCETAGQYLYIHAIADQAHLAYSAPIISAYCAVSVLWAALFLRERLSARHYGAVALTILGIILMGVLGL